MIEPGKQRREVREHRRAAREHTVPEGVRVAGVVEEIDIYCNGTFRCVLGQMSVHENGLVIRLDHLSEDVRIVRLHRTYIEESNDTLIHHVPAFVQICWQS